MEFISLLSLMLLTVALGSFPFPYSVPVQALVTLLVRTMLW